MAASLASCRSTCRRVSSVVVDIGASNVEELMGQMQRYRGSHEDFDAFVVPKVPALKQQQDTIATLIELSRLGVPASRLTLVFNMIEAGVTVAQGFDPLLAFLKQQSIARVNLNCKLGANEIYGRIKGTKTNLAALANDPTDYKALIAQANSTLEKLALAQKLATRRLASGVVPELDACFAALEFQP